ncbi:hypothetical protein KC353_g3547 [Hortaea werneckii]|nr:hypothetical protein KC353_g3547 [Hortaea werneckii]
MRKKAADGPASHVPDPAQTWTGTHSTEGHRAPSIINVAPRPRHAATTTTRGVQGQADLEQAIPAEAQDSSFASRNRLRDVDALSLSTDRSRREDSEEARTVDPSYSEISWAAMFDHFLEQRGEDRQKLIDKGSITYLGESFPLALLIEDFHDGENLRLHHAGPPLQDSNSPNPRHHGRLHPPHMAQDDIEYLKAKGAFDYPPTDLLSALVDFLLDKIFPLYPVVDREEFRSQHRSQTVPWILLHACCFVALTFCESRIFYRAGFSSRTSARLHFYNKAKVLFDATYESNKITVLQSTILLSFWGGRPNSYWNFYTWISTGVTIAETLGLHRSLKMANIKGTDRRLLRRLWWILVIRDASSSALMGRPFRINTDHADAEMLSAADFDSEEASPRVSMNVLARHSGLYQIEMAKISLILRDLVSAGFLQNKPELPLEAIHERLKTWERELPSTLRWPTKDKALDPLAATLLVAFHHVQILACLGQARCQKLFSTSSGGNAVDGLVNKMSSNAEQVSALATVMTTRSHEPVVPHEFFQAVFTAGVVGFTQMRSGVPTTNALGRAALYNCSLVLSSVRETYDPAPWMINLLDRLSGMAGHVAVTSEQEGENGAINDWSAASGWDASTFWGVGDTAFLDGWIQNLPCDFGFPQSQDLYASQAIVDGTAAHLT